MADRAERIDIQPGVDLVQEREAGTQHAELDKRKAGQPSELLDTLIAYKHSEMFRLDKPRPTGFKLPVLK